MGLAAPRHREPPHGALPPERWRFLGEFLRHPRLVGAVTPSSRYLARAVAAQVPAAARCVIELGPGTGAITRALLARLGPQATLLAVEVDPAFCAVLRRALPDPRLHVIQALAQDLPVRQAGFGPPVEAIVSGLPFVNFSPALRRQIMAAADRALVHGGTFVGYSYGPLVLPGLLRATFGECRLAGIVWRNLPPAFVFAARKTKPAEPGVFTASKGSPLFGHPASGGSLGRGLRW
jgi:phospholipid N-methyltransferase